MANLITDRRDIDFVLYEQLDVLALSKFPKYKGYNRKTFDLIISEARNFALKELLPIWVDGDRVGATFENGQVRVPPSYHRAFKLLCEGEWTALAESPEWGGQGVPITISVAADEFLVGANLTCNSYATFGGGTAKMIELFGTDAQKELFLKNLYTAHWGGTMLLTEADAGSNVGALSTSATSNPDGTYSISGNKIFITNGDQDLTENIIHPVLARIEGDPPGSKGLSLFIVPKIWVNEDGSLGEFNDVVCTGIEEKMGSHGSVTCSLALGGKGKCRGILLGKPGQGMMIMFHMMNEARLKVGFQGFIHGSAAYQYALAYARERRQGYDLEKGKNVDDEQVPIIRHPDVRRMLLWMKSHVEGMRSLEYYIAHSFDMLESTDDPDAKGYYEGVTALLTPVLKTYCAVKGFDICVKAIQVYGGYGYTKDFPVEQLARDVKITSIYEGTDGIQAMDLIGRKLAMNKGAVFAAFIKEMRTAAERAAAIEQLAPLAADVQGAVDRFEALTKHIQESMRSASFKVAFANSVPFLMVMGDVIMAWMLIWRASIASEKLQKKSKGKDLAFYQGQVFSAEYFVKSVLPETLGQMDAIVSGGDAVVNISEEAFGG
ncbi:acyl-CoA dehydrogenase [Desulfosarcina ovata]|uniref:Acyl-CoA dehydrogenase n=2 Tax=Desulfosarcina ovata TaxID=83564 RepID=A0A5K8AL49_9BACT|nr:acyl-CoA dehydrogenase [Desulfosarcina ovata]BBO86587.1 acyl-CoA dehydrogenase [Desulfosarcina ovata subsp. sediminis]BBO93443.1 acyl-CoA dehydrogenase [Desulfosarcina ovata subsp. ovata]